MVSPALATSTEFSGAAGEKVEEATVESRKEKDSSVAAAT